MKRAVPKDKMSEEAAEKQLGNLNINTKPFFPKQPEAPGEVAIENEGFPQGLSQEPPPEESHLQPTAGNDIFSSSFEKQFTGFLSSDQSRLVEQQDTDNQTPNPNLDVSKTSSDY